MAKVRKRTLPSGEVRWLADYFDASGTRRSKQFNKRKDADAYLVKVRRDLQLGTHVADSASITIREAAKLWLERCDAGGLERSTRAAYAQHVQIHILPLIGARKLSQFNTPHVHAFADELAKDRSPAMVKRVVRSLGAIFVEARRRGLAATNPVSDAKVKTADRRKSKRPEIPTKAELRSILLAAEGKHRALIITALFSGLRASELRGLRWNAVDLKRGVLTVKGRVDAWGDFGLPKTSAGERDVPLAPLAINALKQQRLSVPNGPDGLVFPSDEGTPLDHHNILARVWTPLLVGAGLFRLHPARRDADGNQLKVAKYNFHALRHAAASLFIEQKLSPKRVQTIMGHSSITVTFDTYGHLFEDEAADQTAVAEIEARLLS
ncbi:site-specific integrase [Mesorhizobium sp. WSM3864]|uniref:tyrosine-type recombinase/integrase n=1 Tax=Mesorhizobium sp. WSM3864 TaxID=2029404 RepID=UPI000BB06A47|nr:site-specific integrase [Mesorhizobium sp. WSM3864]PBB91712.1 site-specific integrase [Mesorhizobium sp. WSM3864]